MNIQQAYPLGKTADSGEMEHLLGYFGRFKHIDPDATTAVKKVISEMDICARWVKNNSGGAVTPGTIVTWDTGSTYGPFRATGAAAVSGTSFGAGVVDPFLPSSGVADGDHYWLITFGYCQFRFDDVADIAVGDVVGLSSSGYVGKIDLVTPTVQEALDRCGRALEAITTAGASAGDLFDGFADFRA